MDGGLTTHITRLLVDPELNEALTALQVAKNHLDLAVDQDMVEAACYEITAAELRLRAIIRRAKAERGDMVGQVDASRKRLFEDQGAVPRVWPHGGRQNRHTGSEGQYPLSVWPGNAPDTADERV